MGLSIAVIYGSVRSERQGIRAARFMVEQLQRRGHQVTLLDPLERPLPMLDRMFKEYAAGEAPPVMAEIGQVLKDADGFIVVSGEYNHSVPPVLKNLLDHYQSEYFYKPSGIVTYSAGPFGGVRALITLRAILAELGTPSIPSAFPVSGIGRAFDEDGQALDTAYERRVTGFLDEFEWYGRAMKLARDAERQDDEPPTQQSICRG